MRNRFWNNSEISHRKPGLRVFGVAWHTTHGYSLGQLEWLERYDMVVEPWRRGFALSQRPMPVRMDYVTHFTPNYYDFALLHIDQQSIYDPDAGDNLSKGRLFQELKDIIQEKDPTLPIVVINHMTPFHDKYETHEVINKIKKMTEGCYMICNSYEAQKQWGWGEVITHGLDANDWGYDVEHFNKTGIKREPAKEPRAIIVLSPAGMEKAYRRQFATDTLRILEEMEVPCVWVGVDPKYKFTNFDAYRDFMAKSLLFFFPAWQSPRPRSRTEAMLSNQCIVTTPYQDADKIFTSGRFKQKVENNKVVEEHCEYDDKTNAFFTDLSGKNDPRTISNPQYTADLIRYLVLERPELAIEMGRRARKLAIETMPHENWQDQWKQKVNTNDKKWKTMNGESIFVDDKLLKGTTLDMTARDKYDLDNGFTNGKPEVSMGTGLVTRSANDLQRLLPWLIALTVIALVAVTMIIVLVFKYLGA